MRCVLTVCLCLFAFPLFALGPWKACHGDVPCPLGDRSYHVLEPDGWDGTSPLPVLLHFHGWKRQGPVVVNHERIAGHTRLRGVLLVAPNGERRTWDFWTSDTPDVGFAANVLANVADRYPVDQDNIFVSGYSFGGAMAWRYVCENGADVRALLAIAGSIGQTETCPEAPKEVRHVHGLSDTVMDFPMGPGGDVTYPVVLWRGLYGCGSGVSAGAWSVVEKLTFERIVWDNCAEGKVTLDLHPRGHFIPRGWIGRQLDEILGLGPTYP